MYEMLRSACPAPLTAVAFPHPARASFRSGCGLMGTWSGLVYRRGAGPFRQGLMPEIRKKR